MIKMIIEVVVDMRYFLLILFLTVMGFGEAFLALSNSNDEAGQFITPNNFWISWKFSYLMILGVFDTTAFGTNDTVHLVNIYFFI
jgi:hypothetical protein